MKEKKQILIVDDHTIVRQGLCALLSSTDNLEVSGEAEDGMDAIRLIESNEPDLVLLDLSMPKMDGFSVIKDINIRYPNIKILVLTMHKSEEYILETFKSGADGYCLKVSDHQELLMAIRSVLAGKQYVSPEISGKIL